MAGPLPGGFSFSAPIPPLTFFRGQVRVASLGHRGLKGIQDAGILALASKALETRVEFPGILPGKLRDGVNAEQREIAKHRGTDGDEVVKTAW